MWLRVSCLASLCLYLPRVKWEAPSPSRVMKEAGGNSSPAHPPGFLTSSLLFPAHTFSPAVAEHTLAITYYVQVWMQLRLWVEKECAKDLYAEKIHRKCWTLAPAGSMAAGLLPP